MSAHDLALISIKPEHAKQIYAGEKRAELRKSFGSAIRIIFMYETAPVSAVTGAFLVGRLENLPVGELLDLVGEYGVPSERARAYYGKRNTGWVITVRSAVKFKREIPLSKLQSINHQFAPPQSFAYVSLGDSTGQTLHDALLASMESRLAVRPIAHGNKERFAQEIRETVRRSYDDIDEDFIGQVVDPEIGVDAAFSTLRKHIVEVRLGDQVIGFSALTEKAHGSWKTGPTILLPDFRGLMLGGVLRRKIEMFCKSRGAVAVYCTCASNSAPVVAYLLNSGMQIQARLRRHLGADRDELVFAKRFGRLKPTSCRRRVVHAPWSGKLKLVRVSSTSRLLTPATKFMSKEMARWYFRPQHAFGGAVKSGLENAESGSTRYSSKNKELYCLHGRGGAVFGAILATVKRSRMVKLNVFWTALDTVSMRRLLAAVLRRARTARRIYLTVPADEGKALDVLLGRGFQIEGVLTNPFETGVDHLCLGWLPKE